MSRVSYHLCVMVKINHVEMLRRTACFFFVFAAMYGIWCSINFATAVLYVTFCCQVILDKLNPSFQPCSNLTAWTVTTHPVVAPGRGQNYIETCTYGIASLDTVTYRCSWDKQMLDTRTDNIFQLSQCPPGWLNLTCVMLSSVIMAPGDISI